LQEKNHLNPQNGLCLNCLHHKAFDAGYFTILEDYSIKTSAYLEDFSNSERLDFLKKFDGKYINSPLRFVPKSEFLAFYRETVFKG
jgi:putative restriction endonuclease